MGDDALTDSIAFLANWFLSHCDGDWEHDTRIEIATLDNPGWSLSINLVGSELEGVTLEYVILRDEDPGWVHAWSDGQKFEAAAGPLGLPQAIDIFRRFSSGEAMSGRRRAEPEAAVAPRLEVPAIHYDR